MVASLQSNVPLVPQISAAVLTKWIVWLSSSGCCGRQCRPRQEGMTEGPTCLFMCGCEQDTGRKFPAKKPPTQLNWGIPVLNPPSAPCPPSSEQSPEESHPSADCSSGLFVLERCRGHAEHGGTRGCVSLCLGQWQQAMQQSSLVCHVPHLAALQEVSRWCAPCGSPTD